MPSLNHPLSFHLDPHPSSPIIFFHFALYPHKSSTLPIPALPPSTDSLTSYPTLPTAPAPSPKRSTPPSNCSFLHDPQSGSVYMWISEVLVFGEAVGKKKSKKTKLNISETRQGLVHPVCLCLCISYICWMTCVVHLSKGNHLCQFTASIYGKRHSNSRGSNLSKGDGADDCFWARQLTCLCSSHCQQLVIFFTQSRGFGVHPLIDQHSD